ncbi:hypothetical protein [Alteriqipengyuania sp. 357]
MPGIKKIIMPIALLAGGVGIGSGAAYATAMVLGSAEGGGAGGSEAGPTTLVKVEDVIAPLVLPDGQRLAGYVSFQLALQVPEDKADEVSAHIPLLLHEINMRTYRTPMASGPDGTLPTLEVFRQIVQEAADIAFEKGTVSAVAISGARPA